MSKKNTNCFLVLILLISLFLQPCILIVNASGNNDMGVETIKVVMDDNYPPYVFKDSSGEVQGILIDQWKLFEQKTGIDVQIEAIEWNKALEGMEQGRYDVIDTIFYNEERAKMYDFTKEYAQIEVPIFFNRNISGITEISSLKGFTVAAKSGDNAVQVLKNNGITDIKLYDSYEDIIRDAAQQKIVTFVMDKPPALYFMYKYQIQDKFNYSGSLYTGSFHRAVKKGDAQLLHVIEDGFSKISKSEYNTIEEKWYGNSPIDKTLLRNLSIIGFGAVFLILVMFIWNWSLQRRVNQKTSELRYLVDELKTSETRVRAILEVMPDMLFLLNRDGTFEDLHGSKDTNTSNGLFLGKKVGDVFPGELGQRFRDSIGMVFTTNEQQTMEYMIEEDNEINYFESRLIICGSEQVVCIVRNITDRKISEQTIQRQVADLEAKNAEMERFTYTVSHDLKSPLITIKGFSGMILKDIEKQRYDLIALDARKIENAANKMQDLLEDLLELSRIGRMVSPSSNFFMTEVAKEVAELLHGDISNKSVSLVIYENMPVVTADRARISEVIQNLVENAVKFMGETEKPEVIVGYRVENGENIFFVKDNGIGIAKAYHHKIFELFDKLNPATEGTGIGLALVKRIIKLHKGRIWVESEQGKGATFFFTINTEAREQ